jgi:hypothetical protein
VGDDEAEGGVGEGEAVGEVDGLKKGFGFINIIVVVVVVVVVEEE